jgi:hypothetical protein
MDNEMDACVNGWMDAEWMGGGKTDKYIDGWRDKWVSG